MPDITFIIMTSEQRREARYKRRQAKRLAKRKALLEKCTFEKVISRSSLSKAADQAARGVRYKASVKRFLLRKPANISIIHHKLKNGQDVRKGFVCFKVVERGKLRKIMSVHFSERVPQKSLNQNALVPVLTRPLIYDNGASRAGMGTSHAMKRLKIHLRRHFKRHGRNGYVLQIDFKDYFANIDHEIAKGIVSKAFDDERIVSLTNGFIDAYYIHNYKMAKKSGDDPSKVEHKGLGLGSEINQTLAISVPSPLDHFIKEVLGIKAYARYNDDSYLIHESKDYLKYCLKRIKEVCARLKITVNDKKTKIVSLTRCFTFLKCRTSITDSGKVLMRPCRKAITRQRHKMRKQKGLLDAGILTLEDVAISYTSCRGYMSQKNARRTIHNLDILYFDLFGQRVGVKKGANYDGRKDHGNSGGDQCFRAAA